MGRIAPGLIDDLASEHLQILGGCALAPKDGLPDYRSLALIGPSEPAFWPHVSTTAEFRDGAPDPLDRWSRRVLTDIAGNHAAYPLFPFGGAPYHPFYGWALRSGRLWASPIQFLVHDSAGLFVSFRGALALREKVDFDTGTRPCDTCSDRPCETACPVGAFADGYDVAGCKAHLSDPAGALCLTGGCLARRACPVGKGRRLPEQAHFHMKAFL